MDIRGLTVHELWVEGASEIASEYYASVIFDRSAKAPLIDALDEGRDGHRGGRRRDPEAIARLHVDPLLGFQDFHGRRLAFEAGRRRRRRPAGRRDARQALRGVRRRGGDARRGQPADRHAGARGQGARRQGHARRQRAVPPPRQRRAARPLAPRTRRSGWPRSAASTYVKLDGNIGDPRQRRRARDVDARRRRPGGRPAGQLPRRRRRLEGRGDHAARSR